MAFVAKGCSLKQAAANSVAFKFNTKARLSVQSVIDEVSEGDGCRSYALMRSSDLHQAELYISMSVLPPNSIIL